MVSVGSKALPSMGRLHDYETSHKRGGKSKKPKKDNASAAFDAQTTHVSNKHRNTFTSAPQPSRIRKQIDPETTKCFSEIANLFESEGVKLEERSLIRANALDETWGKEFATDYILSHTLETILQCCDAENLCAFLQNSANDFPLLQWIDQVLM